MKVYLDDERETPRGWVRTYTAEHTIALLKTGTVEHLSLDHDLGNEAAGTGYDVLVWLEEQVATGQWIGHPLPSIEIHSANLPARDKMLAAIAKITSMT